MPNVRKAACLIIIFLAAAMSHALVSNVCAQQQGLLNIGDSLPDYMKKYLVKFKRPMPDISKWYEGTNLTILSYAKGYDPGLPVILVSNDRIPFGVLQGEKPNAHYLFDTDGDGKLDYKGDLPIVPIWLVAWNSTVKDSKDKAPEKFMNLLYETFQSDKGPKGGNKIQQALSTLQPYYLDTKRPNRDLMYDLDYYIKNTKNPPQAILAMKFMEKWYSERYNRVHPVILLYLLESNINAGNIDEARKQCERLLKAAPDFIPARFYQWQLQEDPRPGDPLAIELKRTHPNHWLVKEIK